jgi:FAD synthase
VEVAFVARIRGMTRFGSVEDLVERMHTDVQRCRVLLGLAT